MAHSIFPTLRSCAIMGIFPLIKTLETWGGTNRVANQMVEQLQAINLELKNGTDPDECAFFFQTLFTWVAGITGGSKPAVVSDSQVFLLFLSVEPVRCTDYWSGYDGVPTASYCYWFDTGAVSHPSEEARVRIADLCEVWRGTTHNTTIEELANRAGIRSGAVSLELNQTVGTFTSEFGSNDGTTFTVTAKFNHTYSIQPAAFSSFLLQIALLVCVLGGLSILRRDSGLLVLGPLRRMLKIVARYAKNPLSEVKVGGTDSDDEDSEDDNENDSPEGKLGNYETEQLINAVSKITDLLRKCWGVAGADIISTNLATREGALTEVFNPTVPGKSVYALFGFAAINGFDHTLRQLGGDVMILINDVAAVLHGEVFRWGFGDSGQCNKNLGAAFLMVFRIGLVKEVIQKLEQATDVVFSNSANKKHATGILKRPTHNKRNSSDIPMSKAATRTVMAERRRKTQRTNSNRAAMSVSLQSLPGIQTFTDRAVVGMLKSFAGIYRDNKLLSWKNDFRLGAGVGAFSVNMIFGMDAGWAVEGAVGSEYKIDATYLSPHVNMASRMMSACKQYGVSILLSQAVQELMSGMARSKLRHLDTITVKGSSLKQKIYTYDARHKGVDFFLFSRSDEQADVDSDRYSPNVWNTDQDLRAMRQHVTEDFEFEFNKGRDAYLAGDWPKALKHLEAANEIMVENVMDQGYIQDELNELQNRVLDGEDARAAEEELRNETGDGPSRRLIAYMESEGKVPPEGWKGYRPLTSK
jgi:Adenylate and Guanylate cyclase catalytic domain